MARTAIARTLTTTLLAAAVLTGTAITGITHETPLGDYVGTGAPSKPVNEPTWTTSFAARFPGCVDALPEGQIPSSVVVVRLTGEVTKMRFGRAWDRIENNNPADDIWVVGQCA